MAELRTAFGPSGERLLTRGRPREWMADLMSTDERINLGMHLVSRHEVPEDPFSSCRDTLGLRKVYLSVR